MEDAFLKKYYQQPNEDVVESVFKTLEKETGKDLFTLKIFRENQEHYTLEFVAAFQDKSMMLGIVKVDYEDNQIACRLRGSFL